MKYIFTLLITVALFADVDTEYIKIYEYRIVEKQALLGRFTVEGEFLANRFERMRKLLEKGAITQEEYERVLSEVKKNDADIQFAEAKVVEAEAQLVIVRHQLAKGQSVPICD